jgi:uncharacterized protein YdaU (DUF1376 family)
MDDKVIVMNLEEIGAYIKLLCFCWNNNGLTKNQKDLKNMCGNPKNWEHIWGKVSKCFYEKNEKYYNRRLEKEHKKQKAWRKKSQLGGIKSGISRGKMVEPNMKGGSQMVHTKLKPKGNSSSSSSSSSSKKPLKHKDEKPVFKEKELEEEFEEFWKGYRIMGNPKDDIGDKKEARKAFKVLRKKTSKEEIIKAFHGEADYLKHERLDNNFDKKKKYASTWLRSDRWKEHKDFKYKARL